MIERQTAYKVGDQVFATIREAQESALKTILGDLDAAPNELPRSEHAATLIVDNAEQVKAILGVRQRKPRTQTVTRKSRKMAAATNAALQDMKQ